VADRAAVAASALLAGLLTGPPASGPTSDPANCESRPPETVATTHTSPTLDDFPRITATLTGADGEAYTLCVLVADTPELQGRGLMGVADAGELGGADGMVFVWDEPTTARFYMWNTPLPLTLAFFDSGGAWMGGADMDPCAGTDASACERFSAPAPYCAGLEVPHGTFGEALGPGASLSLDGSEEAAQALPPSASAPTACEL
jgi:uncharacterized membrane protein (UPF0127 family)